MTAADQQLKHPKNKIINQTGILGSSLQTRVCKPLICANTRIHNRLYAQLPEKGGGGHKALIKERMPVFYEYVNPGWYGATNLQSITNP